MPWSAALLCPCGCGGSIQLSLIAGDTPSWRVRRHFNGSVTLHPSVWGKTGCRSHFFLRRGRIVWAVPLRTEPNRDMDCDHQNHAAQTGPGTL